MKTLLLFITFIILMFYIQIKLLNLLFSKTKNIFHFKLYNIRWSLSVCFIYVFFFIFILYFLRLKYRDRLVDLKYIYHSLLPLFFDLPNFIVISFILIVFLCLHTFFLLMLLLHKWVSHEFFCLLIYLNYNYFFEKNKYTKYIYEFLYLTLKGKTLITLIFRQTQKVLLRFLHDLEINLLLRPNMEFDPFVHYQEKNEKYSILKLLSVLVDGFHFRGYVIKFVDPLFKLIPLFLFLYDIFFNNFVISHLYKFLPYYIPIILLQKLSYTMSYDIGVGDCLWDMYYKKEQCIYLAPSKVINILYFHINNQIDTLKLFKSLPDGYDTALPILDAVTGGLLRFTLSDKQKNIYENFVIPFPGIMYVQKVGNRFFLVGDFDEKDNPILDEEYFLIFNKYNDIS